MTVTIRSSAADILKAVRSLYPDFDSQDAAALKDAVAEEELLQEMVSYGKNVTGIENTVFISPRGRTRHAARVKVAIDPPRRIDPQGGKDASVAIADGALVEGDMPPALLKQVQRFVALNRDVLIDYWEYRILTDELQRRLRSI
jgi:hypothetical protein